MHDDITRYRGRYLSLVERAHWEFVTRSNAHAVAVLVATTPEREIVLVEQYRRPLDARVIELPAGLVGDTGDPNEAVLDAAGRELIEETGFEARSLEVVMECPTSSGMTDEVITFVRADRLRRVGPGGGDDSEDIEVHVVPLGEVDAWLDDRRAQGLPLDPKIYTALYWLSQERGEE
jgi:ADP-ribose pyrophosphatase